MREIQVQNDAWNELWAIHGFMMNMVIIERVDFHEMEKKLLDWCCFGKYDLYWHCIMWNGVRRNIIVLCENN